MVHAMQNGFLHNCPLILLYHRIADVAEDPYKNCVSPGNFRSHLEILRNRASVVSISEIRLPAQTNCAASQVVLTFDDGYGDWLVSVLPLLQELHIPAACFVVPGYVDAQREFWWDELYHIVRGGSDDSLWRAGERLGLCSSSRRSNETPFGRLYYYGKSLPASLRTDFLQTLREVSGLRPTVRPGYRPLTSSDVRTLARAPGITVGAHTCFHEVMINRGLEEQIRDVSACCARLRDLTGLTVDCFSYPHGCFGIDFDAISILALERVGLSTALSVGWPIQRCSRLAIPRLVVPNCDTDTFHRLLDWWL
jgi:peptidoglycan/xylan/chitin deacetylase (PgdA/CDA1 family)